MGDLQAPFPWFGGKSRVAEDVWKRFGDVANYVEPFFGSGAVMLKRPDWHNGDLETVNDKDGYVTNFWRAIKHAAGQVAEYCDCPANENDLHARHAWLVGQKNNFVSRLEGDPEFYDAKIAGYWCWGMALWIGGKFCSGEGPWVVDAIQKRLIKRYKTRNKGRGVQRRLIHLGNKGRGVQRRRIHEWFDALAERMRATRVCCGDWSRVCGHAVTITHGLTGMFLDPPYTGGSGRDEAIYAEEDLSVGHDVRAWCVKHGDNPLMRIALCGYEGEHDELINYGWNAFAWKATGGMGTRRGPENAYRERIWFSPHCLSEKKAVKKRRRET